MCKKKIIFFIIFGAFILRLVNLNQSFWLDEAAQVIESSRPFAEQFDLNADFHPPLYHVLLHFWMKFTGKSEFTVRLLSVFFGILSIFFSYKVMQKIGNELQAILTMIIISLSAYHIWYSQEARPYMIFVFLSMLSLYSLMYKRWYLYFFSNVLMLYSNYFAFFPISVHLFIKQKNKKDNRKFLTSYFLSLASFIFWIPFFLEQLQTGVNGGFTGWKQVVSFQPFKAIGLMFAKFILGKGSIENNILYILTIFPQFYILIYSLKYLINKKEFILIKLFIIPLISAFLVSIFIPVLAPQRLLFLLPVFFMIITTTIKDLKSYSAILIILVSFISGIYGLYDYYTNPYVQRENWRAAVKYTENLSEKESLSLSVFPDSFAPIIWYQKDPKSSTGIAPDFIFTENNIIEFEKKITDKNPIYLYQYLSNITDPNNLVHDVLINNNFLNTETKDFPGVGFVYKYEKI